SWPSPSGTGIQTRQEQERVVNDDRDPDAQSFREAMRDVRRLRHAETKAPTAPKPPPRARFTRADQKEVLKESLQPPADDTILETGDELNFRRPHIPETVLLKLRRGQYAVDAEIDLHGMTGAEAKAALREFVTEAVNRRMSCVRIIHGKGRRSGPRGPVLKNVVNQWLQRIDNIQAFGSARQVDGGSGAVYVLLRVK
ncbi:MAG: Smr/MutS family protein, partial [Dokdonella sp.]